VSVRAFVSVSKRVLRVNTVCVHVMRACEIVESCRELECSSPKLQTKVNHAMFNVDFRNITTPLQVKVEIVCKSQTRGIAHAFSVACALSRHEASVDFDVDADVADVRGHRDAAGRSPRRATAVHGADTTQWSA
jgi:hypothetical protein